MKTIFALLVGIAIGVGVWWYYSNNRGRSDMRADVRSACEQVESAAKSAGVTIEEKLRALNLRPEDIKDDLARTGKVIRRKAQEAGQAIGDATADARATTALK